MSKAKKSARSGESENVQKLRQLMEKWESAPKMPDNPKDARLQSVWDRYKEFVPPMILRIQKVLDGVRVDPNTLVLPPHFKETFLSFPPELRTSYGEQAWVLQRLVFIKSLCFQAMEVLKERQ